MPSQKNTPIESETLPSSQVAYSKAESMAELSGFLNYSLPGELIEGSLNQAVLNMGKKERRLSFIQIQSDPQKLVEKLIREEIMQQCKTKTRKMSLDDDETCLFSSDIYRKVDSHWRNRETSQLTSKKLDDLLITQVKKIKLLNEHPMVGYNLFRATLTEKQTRDFAIGCSEAPSWFGYCVWIGLVSQGHQICLKKSGDGDLEGYVLKKSQFLGNWELRYVSISAKNGLVSSRKKGESVTVKINQVSQIWTRLETIKYEGNTYVILKVWHMMFKYQIGVRVDQCVRWAKSLSTLVK